MANRYWVGGTAAWDGTAGTKWSATSGGAGGASVPTTSDDVFFDASSTGTVTISTGNTGAQSVNCTGFTGTLAGSAALTVVNSYTLSAGMTYTYSGTLTFTRSGTLTTAGKSLSSIIVGSDSAAITVTLGDALTSSGTITITRGELATANYNLTAQRIITGTLTGTKTLTLGSSTISISSDIDVQSPSVYVVNAGTSQINFTASSGTANLGGKTYYNVSWTATLGTGTTRTLKGANTFNNLTLTAPSGNGIAPLSIDSDQTINGTFSCTGATILKRGAISSDIPGTARTLTVAAVSLDNCDFRDITIAGAASPISPANAGNCGNNTNITFPAAKTVYRVGTNTTWEGSSSWATSSGGTGADSNFPLAQDTAVIDNSTALTGTLAVGLYNIGALNCSTRTTGITLNYNTTPNWHGSHTLSSAITVTGTSNQSFQGRGTTDFTSAGRTITFPITLNVPGGTFSLQDAFNSSNSLTHNRGTVDANNYNLTCTTFSSSNSNTRTITMGSGLWTISGTGVAWDLSTSTNLTFNKNTANILLSDTTTTARTFRAGGLTYNKLTIGGTTGTSTLSLIGLTNTSFAELASTKTVAHTISLVNTISTINTWSVTGTPGNVVTFRPPIAGSRQNFTLTNVTSGIDYLSVQDIREVSGNKFYVGANSTDGGNNVNVYFTAAPAPVVSGGMFVFF